MYSNVSADTGSPSSGGESSRLIDGSSESGRSSNSGFCFSFCARSDCTTSTTGLSIRSGFGSVNFSRTSTSRSMRSSEAISPALRSRQASQPFHSLKTAHSIQNPVFSDSQIQDTPLTTDKPAAIKTSKRSVLPTKPKAEEHKLASSVPTIPPGCPGNSNAALYNLRPSNAELVITNRKNPPMTIATTLRFSTIALVDRRYARKINNIPARTIHHAENPKR